jgi:hypothetical protein
MRQNEKETHEMEGVTGITNELYLNVFINRENIGILVGGKVRPKGS